MNKILIVDDEPQIVDVLKEYAKFNGIEADCAYDGMQALEKIEQNNYDCVILDIMMPNLDGYSTFNAMKDIKPIPTIMISAKAEEDDKLQAFELGVDDYICKPFSPKEVFARVKAVLKRTSGFADIMGDDKLRINLQARKVYVCNREIDITNKEYELLLFLIKNKDIILTRDMILNNVWGYDYSKDERTVDTHIKMLRKHLGVCGDCIKTKRGVGYKFEREN